MDCEPDSYLYCGFSKDTDEEEVRPRIEDGTLPEILNKIPVRKGDSYFIETGTVHAIGPGVLICEIQQSSNVTYRLYDYRRRDKYGELRELHVDKAMEVTNFHEKDMEAAKTMECKYFLVGTVCWMERIPLIWMTPASGPLWCWRDAVRIRCGEGVISLTVRRTASSFRPARRRWCLKAVVSY